MNDDLTKRINDLEQRLATFQTDYKKHTHITSDGTQSLSKVSATYGGIVGASTSYSQLPSGWTVSVDGANIYTITHNLGNPNYTVVAQVQAIDVDGGYNISTTSNQNPNYFLLDWYAGGGKVKRDFSFVLTVIT